MAYSGEWRRVNSIPYSGATVWGTGYNPVHERYGSPPVRLGAIPGRQGDVHPPEGSVPEQLVNPEMWGYTLEDTGVTGVDYDNRPSWGEQPDEYRGDTLDHPSWAGIRDRSVPVP